MTVRIRPIASDWVKSSGQNCVQIKVTRGDFVVEGTRFKLSRTPGRTLHANPELGEHSVQVLMEILQYDGDKIADVLASLAME